MGQIYHKIIDGTVFAVNSVRKEGTSGIYAVEDLGLDIRFKLHKEFKSSKIKRNINSK